MDVVEPGVSQMKTEEEEAAPKRGRGRPRKQPKEADETSFPRRPRGRPRGSKNKKPRVTVVEAPKERRARGRPRKWPQKTLHQEEQQSIYPVSREAEPTEGPSDQTPPPAVFQENF